MKKAVISYWFKHEVDLSELSKFASMIQWTPHNRVDRHVLVDLKERRVTVVGEKVEAPLVPLHLIDIVTHTTQK